MATIDDLDPATRALLQKFLTEAEIVAAVAMPGGLDMLKRIAGRIQAQQSKSTGGALVALLLLFLASE